MVYVGSVDAPVTMSNVRNIIAGSKKASGGWEEATNAVAIDVLGWDFAFEVHEVATPEGALQHRAALRCEDSL